MKKYIIILFVLGFLLHLLLSFNYVAGGDQVNMLVVGNKFAQSGQLTGIGKWTGGSGSNIGPFLEIAVGIPLMIWHNFRAPMILIVILNLLTYFILANEFKKMFRLEGVLIFTIIYWLSPIRIYNSGFLWEPAYLFFFSALHFVSAVKLRKNKSIAYTIIHILSIIFAFQIHNSALILLFASMFLTVFKKIKLNIYGIIYALVIGLITYIPTINTFMTAKLTPMKESTGYLGRGFVEVLPLLKGVFYWLKLSAFDVFSELKDTDLPIFIIYFLQTLSILSVIIGIISNWFYYRGKFIKKYHSEYKKLSSDDKWIMSLTLSYALGLILSSGLSPIYLQAWMVIITLPVSMFPLFYLIYNNYTKFSKKNIFYAALLYVSVETILILAIFAGQSKFQNPNLLPQNVNKEQNQEIIYLFK